MKSWKTKRGNEIFQVLSGRSNSYFIPNDGDNILIDTGKDSAYQNLSHNIGKLVAKNENIDLLILTHTHFDHCQNAARIKRNNNCKIAVGKTDEIYIKKGYTPVPAGTTSISKIIYKLGIKTGIDKFKYAPFSPDILIVDNFEYTDENIDLRIISTPGHSLGSVCIIVDNEIAIVGDTLFGVFPNSVFPPFADNANLLMKSWYKLLETDCEIFLPGHGKTIHRKLLQKEYYKFSRKYLRSAV